MITGSLEAFEAITRIEIIMAIREIIEKIPDKTTRGYLDSSDDWIDGYRKGRKDVKKELLEQLKQT